MREGGRGVDWGGERQIRGGSSVEIRGEEG